MVPLVKLLILTRSDEYNRLHKFSNMWLQIMQHVHIRLRSRFGLVITRWSRSTHLLYTSGPVSAWMGDRLRTGKPPRRRTRHPGLLSLNHPSVDRRNKYPGKDVRVNRHIALYTSPCPKSRRLAEVGWCLAEDYLTEISADVEEAVAHQRRVRDDVLYNSTFTLSSAPTDSDCWNQHIAHIQFLQQLRLDETINSTYISTRSTMIPQCSVASSSASYRHRPRRYTLCLKKPDRYD